MPRQPRVWYPGAMYHIVARGNRRAAIFHDHIDFQTYLSILEDVRSMMPFVLHSYCLMTNHLHLQLETLHYHIHERNALPLCCLFKSAVENRWACFSGPLWRKAH